ncbi:sodium:calcium antiporter [Candidatus Microgenomates bacterium]|nr:sodium:calcium antiporter [Candidatus Microgenomates bacterium]
MLSINIFLYGISFVALWFGAGLIISSVEKLSQKLKASSFAISFFLLGLLTSIPEFAVGLTSIAQHDPEIFVGNLLGGIAVIFLLVIPVLAIFGKGITLHHQFENKTLLFTLAVIGAPSLLIIDRRISVLEGVVFIILYLLLFYFVERKKGVFDQENTHILEVKAYSFIDLLKVLSGVVIAFISSQIIVDKTLYFSEVFRISPFYISIIILSIGTNLPELSLAVRSVISGKKEIAFGDYMGSAAANTLLFGVFTILNGGEVLTMSNFVIPFMFISIGLGLFYFFSSVKDTISRNAGFVMLAFYIVFAFLELGIR